ncbi:phosphotyrosine protein phosphatase [Oceaniferula spumae]|uniref:Phosphotyrosine protein phosphatase n=1 Tax=Oceaniferula spumae TaxID=2979115 RepID=A0AAT9FG88_9BACT
MPDPPLLNVLFVCAKNQWRSPTAAAVFRNDARLNVQSAGLSRQSPCEISAKLLHWADVVMVMEHEHASRIRDRFRNSVDLPDIVSLEIPDDYPFMDATLITLIQSAVEEVLECYL